MSVNTFDPGTSTQTEIKQTTTQEAPNKVIAKQATANNDEKSAARIGFVSLGWLN